MAIVTASDITIPDMINLAEFAYNRQGLRAVVFEEQNEITVNQRLSDNVVIKIAF